MAKAGRFNFACVVELPSGDKVGWGGFTDQSAASGGEGSTESGSGGGGGGGD